MRTKGLTKKQQELYDAGWRIVSVEEGSKGETWRDPQDGTTWPQATVWRLLKRRTNRYTRHCR